eukprot:3932997-Rhodomonas_salina.3
MAKRFLLCALFACSVAGTRASNNETCPSEACIRIAEEEYRGWPCEDGPNCTWTLLDLEFTVTKTEVGSGDDLNLTGISGGPFLYTKACRRFFLQYFDGINGSRAYNCSITNVKSLPDDVFTSDIIFCTISWLVEMSVLFHCWHQCHTCVDKWALVAVSLCAWLLHHQSRTTDEESDEVGDMAQITMLAGRTSLIFPGLLHLIARPDAGCSAARSSMPGNAGHGCLALQTLLARALLPAHARPLSSN